MKSARIKNCSWVAISISIALLSGNAAAQNAKPIDVSKARVADYWTSERRAMAIPRDLVIDPRGLGYLRRPDGSLQPHGHNVAAQASPGSPIPSPFGKPSGGGHPTVPTITDLNPAAGATIGVSYTFTATVTDPSGVKSVIFKIQQAGSPERLMSATKSAGTDVWSVALQGFTDGDWSWSVEAKDKPGNGGNTATAGPVAFTVSTGGGSGGGSGSTVTNAQWTAGGAVNTAAGRLYFEMPGNTNRTLWSGYVCSGTVATDLTDGRSVIITAAHCVYDDANKAFARNVMFIPDQADTSGTRTDLDCSNDPMGCWLPSFGVVDVNWTTRTFPDNMAWDYAFYVVADSGAHRVGTAATSDALDAAAGSLPVSFGAPVVNVPDSSDFTYALGYSYNVDPKFMYCAEDMTTNGAVNWWLASCGLSGGSSGGPWVQPMDTSTGTGPIISMNSWKYTDQPAGIAGPKLAGTSAVCVFGAAKVGPFSSTTPLDGEAGIKVDPSTNTCQKWLRKIE